MKPLLLIRNEPTDSMGIAPSVFERLGHSLRVLDAWETGTEWPAPEEVSGIVVFGGDMNADEVNRHPYLLVERDLLRRTVEEDVPLLGVCLGAQVLARALGAEVRPAPVKEWGFRPVHPTDEGARDPVLGAVRSGARVFQWHRDTFDLPEGSGLLATGSDVRNQAFRAGTGVWGIQFHPEVTLDNIELWISGEDAGELAAEWGRDPNEVLAEAKVHLKAQHEIARDLFGRFSRVVRENASARG